MRQSIVKCIGRLIAPAKNERAALFNIMLKDIEETWELKKQVDDKLLYKNVGKALQAILDTVSEIHTTASMPEEIREQVQAGFDEANPKTWKVPQSQEILMPTKLAIKLPTDKAYYEAMHPDEPLNFIPKEISLRLCYELGPASIGSSQATISMNPENDDEPDLTRVALTVKIPYETIFATTKNGRITPATLKCYLDSLYQSPYLQESLATSIRRVIETSNFIEDIAFVDELPAAFAKKYIPLPELEDIKNESYGPFYSHTAAGFDEHTTDVKLLKGFILMDRFMIAAVCVRRYQRLYSSYQAVYYRVFSKTLPISKTVSEIIANCTRVALQLLLKLSESALDPSKPELNTQVYLEQTLDSLPNTLAFFRLEDYERLFNTSLSLTICNLLQLLFIQKMKGSIDSCIIVPSPDHAHLKIALAPDAYVRDVFYGSLHPQGVASSRIYDMMSVAALSLLDLPFETANERLSISQASQDRLFALFPQSRLGPHTLDNLFNPSEETGEPIIRQLFKQGILECIDAIGILDTADPEEIDELGDSLLEKCLNELGLEDIYFYRAGEQEPGQTYFQAYLIAVAIDLYSTTALDVIAEPIAKSFTQEMLHRSMIKDTPFEQSYELYKYTAKLIADSKTEAWACIMDSYDAVFNVYLLSLNALVIQSTRPLWGSSLGSICVGYQRALKQIAKSDSSDMRLVAEIVKEDGETIKHSELKARVARLLQLGYSTYTQALAFFRSVEQHSKDMLCLDETTGQRVVVSYEQGKGNPSRVAEASMAIYQISELCSGATAGSKVSIKKPLGIVCEQLLEILEELQALSLGCFVRSSEPKTIPNTAKGLKEQFFLDSEEKAALPIQPKAAISAIEKQMLVLLQLRTRDDRLEPLSTLLYQQGQEEPVLSALAKYLVYCSDKLEMWPYSEGPSRGSMGRVLLMYKLIYFYELVCRTECAIVLDRL